MPISIRFIPCIHPVTSVHMAALANAVLRGEITYRIKAHTPESKNIKREQVSGFLSTFSYNSDASRMLIILKIGRAVPVSIEEVSLRFQVSLMNTGVQAVTPSRRAPCTIIAAIISHITGIRKAFFTVYVLSSEF